MALAGVIRGTKKPPRVVLYGPPKAGKSTFASEAEKPIFVTTEDGVDSLPVDQYPKAKDYTTLFKTVEKIATESHDYKTIVIDTLNGATELCAKMVCDNQFGGEWISEKGREGFNAYARGWDSVATEMPMLMELLDECRTARDMTVIMLSHTGLHTVKHPSDGDYTKFAPDIDKRVWAKWSKWCDIILRADYDYCIRQSDDNRKGRAEIGDTTRWIYSVGNAAQDAGTRVGYELPEKMSLSYALFADALAGGDDGANKEASELWGVFSKDKANAALKYLGIKSVADIADAPRSKVRATLNRLRQINAEKEEAK